MDNMLVNGYDVVVNKPKTAAYRAPGQPQATFAVESVIDEVAEKLGVDNQPTVGVLAQELIEYRPDLVMMADDGYFRVNYGGLLS